MTREDPAQPSRQTLERPSFIPDLRAPYETSIWPLEALLDRIWTDPGGLPPT